MRYVILLLATLLGAVQNPAVAEHKSLVLSADTFDGKKETCWRTNRSTGQRFRIC